MYPFTMHSIRLTTSSNCAIFMGMAVFMDGQYRLSKPLESNSKLSIAPHIKSIDPIIMSINPQVGAYILPMTVYSPLQKDGLQANIRKIQYSLQSEGGSIATYVGLICQAKC